MSRMIGRVAALLLAAFVTAAGCTARDGDSDAAAGDQGGDEAAVADHGDGGASADVGVGAGAAAEAEGAGGAGVTPALDLVAADRDVVRTGTMRVTVADAPVAAGEVRAIAGEVGGFVADERVQAGDGRVTVTMRVPADAFDDVRAEVRELGDVSDEEVKARDVTAEVVDLDSRIASLRASVERLRDLLGRAGNVDQLAAVEGELAGRETELEALLGQQRVLADQVALGTLTVELGEDPPPRPSADAAGFGDGLRRGWVLMVDGGRLALAAAGFLLPFAAAALPAALAVRWWRARRVAGPPPGAGPAA